MKEFVINKNDAGQRLDKFISKAAPLLPMGLMHKYIRIKRIKINGKRAEFSQKLICGDTVQMYLNDEFFVSSFKDKEYLKVKPNIDIVYEDENIMLVDKKQGMIVHSDDNEQIDTLINHIKAYLYNKKEWNPDEENSFVPALANRIDRNTGGIVIAAKNAESLRILNDKIKNREIKKSYLCRIEGKMNPPSGKMEGYIFKDSVKNRVYVTKQKKPGAKYAGTIYRTIAVKNGLSLMECELITGRTHQIRAQFSDRGCPIVGDGKYGKTSDGHCKQKYQDLYSYKLMFDMQGEENLLSYLNKKQFMVEHVHFAEEMGVQIKQI